MHKNTYYLMENAFCVVQTLDSHGYIQVVIIYFMISLIFLVSFSDQYRRTRHDDSPSCI